MVEISAESALTTQIKLIRKYLKLKIMEDNVSFRNHNQERNNVYDLIKRVIVNGESHSALMIGPRGCGKTTVRANFSITYYIYPTFLSNSKIQVMFH